MSNRATWNKRTRYSRNKHQLTLPDATACVSEGDAVNIYVGFFYYSLKVGEKIPCLWVLYFYLILVFYSNLLFLFSLLFPEQPSFTFFSLPPLLYKSPTNESEVDHSTTTHTRAQSKENPGQQWPTVSTQHLCSLSPPADIAIASFVFLFFFHFYL